MEALKRKWRGRTARTKAVYRSCWKGTDSFENPARKNVSISKQKDRACKKKSENFKTVTNNREPRRHLQGKT